MWIYITNLEKHAHQEHCSIWVESMEGAMRTVLVFSVIRCTGMQQVARPVMENSELLAWKLLAQINVKRTQRTQTYFKPITQMPHEWASI